MSKLYPPYIEGTLPACLYGSNKIIRIPFSMNNSVSPADINGFQVKIKTISNNKELGVLKSHGYSANNEFGFWAEFVTTDSINLKMGQFYKIQMAYIDKNNEVGYYSTVGVIKATSKPTVSIAGFENYAINFLGKTEFVGEYWQDPKNGDYSEKVYSYCFNIYKNNDISVPFLSSGEQLHNSSYDTSGNSSINSYKVPEAFETDVVYQIEYVVTTINKLTYKSPLYSFKRVADLNPNNNFLFQTNINYDDGYVEVSLDWPANISSLEKDTIIPQGQYAICRSNETDAPGIWHDIYYFNVFGLDTNLPRFKDTTVEYGKTYKYAYYQFNDNKVVSKKQPENGIEIKVYFEDAFIFDRNKSLKVRFNPKVSSFKETVLEQKQGTIGNKYPFVFRNGNIKYKEFQISGLISYLMDENENFTNLATLGLSEDKETRKRTIANQEVINNYPSTQLTNVNISSETKFRQLVLDWLNDGEIKCFKSPTEGAFIVRLMNISLSPEDKLNRMLYTFSCTAYEIAEYNINNIYEKVFKSPLISQNIILPKINSVLLTNIVPGTPYYAPDNSLMNNVSVASARPGTCIEVNYAESGTTQSFFVNSTGNLFLGDNITHITLITNDTLGQINYTYNGIQKTSFDNKYGLYLEEIICNQFYGKDLVVEEDVEEEVKTYSTNIIDSIQDKVKKKLNQINFMRFYMDSNATKGFYFKIVENNTEKEYDFSLQDNEALLLHPLSENELDVSVVPLKLYPDKKIVEVIFKNRKDISEIYLGLGINLDISYELIVTDYNKEIIEEGQNCVDLFNAYIKRISAYKSWINRGKYSDSFWSTLLFLQNEARTAYNNLISESGGLAEFYPPESL